MSGGLDKRAVLDALLDQARADLASLQAITRMALDEATGAESKAENKYDTRSLESSYLAAGQGARVLALQRLVSVVEVALGDGGDAAFTLFGLADGGGASWWLLGPDGGGRALDVDGLRVTVVTGESPAGQALAGAEVGDEVRWGQRCAVEVVCRG